MSATNTKTIRSGTVTEERLAGSFGPHAAKQADEMTLRRLVMSCLLWEDLAYTSGEGVAAEIAALVPKVPPTIVAGIACEARTQQKLRHVPLFICREMMRYAGYRHLAGDTLAYVIQRPDELAEFVSLYWKTNAGKKSLSAQAKQGLAKAFQKFDRYQLSKYDRAGKEVSLRDVLFLCHAKPQNAVQANLFRDLANKALAPADTWEVALSAAKGEIDKHEAWTRLIVSGKLPALAFLKNLRNMAQVGVPRAAIANGLLNLQPKRLLPIDFLRAAAAAPDWRRELEDVMYRCCGEFPKLPGWTVFVVDVSRSMGAKLSAKSQFSRIEAAAALAVLAAEMCEHISVYTTAGSDIARAHATEKLPALRGFSLSDTITRSSSHLGGGGIFTRQCLEYIKTQEREQPDRIVVFSDSQDCDFEHSRKPAPFGKKNYIVDVSAHKHGINYKGAWTAEIAGWSEHFLTYIAALESSNLQ